MRTSPTTDAPIDKPGSPANPQRLTATPYGGPDQAHDEQHPLPPR